MTESRSLESNDSLLEAENSILAAISQLSDTTDDPA